LGLYAIVIDPDENAIARSFADDFAVVGGKDFETTCQIVEQFKVSGVVSAATDKPLVMMARIAEKYGFSFISTKTATDSTNKYLMKKVFKSTGITCAKGKLVKNANDIESFPVILKPLDNSGSRGVYYCENIEQAKNLIEQAFEFTNNDYLLAEEVIGGDEYSVESVHFDYKTEVIQITKKITSEWPYNVELGHTQPAMLNQETEEEIFKIIVKVSKALGFNNCVSHTELKINNGELIIIETSPRLGGDFITSHLTPLSTGVNIEQAQIKMAIGEKPNIKKTKNKASGIFYFNFGEGIVEKIIDNSDKSKYHEIVEVKNSIKIGQRLNRIKNSLERYGYVIIQANSIEELDEIKNAFFEEILIKFR
ncbi:MAG: ATP-grasp domain-containing protein, partial [bacterium]